MSGKELFTRSPVPERKIRFRSAAKVLFDNENRVEDLFLHADSKALQNENFVLDYEKQEEKKGTPSLLRFLNVELTRGYMLEHDEEQYSARREKMYTFMKIPAEVEKFMVYGFFQCADAFLFVYTFLPMRFILAFWALICRPIMDCFGLQKSRQKSVLKPAEICDLLKACILISCSMIMSYVDTSMLYHLIKSQSVIKLYIFYNMLEVGDRLFSAFGQDTIDALFWTAAEPRGRKRDHLGVIPHLIFAIIYVFLHSLLVLFQATTLNVAINSNNKALLTIMMSNNFVELKGSVFKKFDKNNLFQVSCSDVRERFHLFVLLFIVVLQTMKEYSWREERFWVLVPDCIMVLGAEVLVDWIKHAFITRFNELPVVVYKDFTTSLAYDVAQTRQKNAFSDHSDLVARRMGFIPLPLGVVMVRVLSHALRVDSPAAAVLLVAAYLCLASSRVLVTVVMLGRACDLVSQHQERSGGGGGPPAPPSWVHRATSPIGSPRPRTPPAPLVRSATVDCATLAPGTPPPEVTVSGPRPDRGLGPAAIFSNSSVRLDSVCLNEALLDEAEAETEMDCVTRSVPNIAAEDAFRRDGAARPADEPAKKRAESEPSIPVAVEAEVDGSFAP
ncbi:protein TAPT1 homolog [Bacillus rossius redtenbacheri]|uniref:protein TAPT1 homolog n=1 Tax=Bacillus rossius redtenbacheri TaxID=93214 RepID=UPI002FDEBD3C